MKIDALNTHIAFKGKQQPSPADRFISDLEKVKKNQDKGDFFARTCWSPTAAYPIFTGLLGYTFYLANKCNELEKAGKPTKEIAKRFPLVIAIGFAIIAGVQYLFNRNSEEKYENIKNLFNKINTDTNATLEDKPFRSSALGASFNPISGKVAINRNLINDPFTNRKCEKLLRHELVHARQHETIARMENGIEKLNYSVLKRVSKVFEIPFINEEFIKIYNDIQANPTKYENRMVYVDGARVDLKNYITALHTLLTNKDAGYNDIPIVLNKEYYEGVRKQKGALTAEENEKAQLYYQAQLDYPQLNGWQIINPFSAYRTNILEVEAFKENPGFYEFIRRIFSK